MLSSLVSNCCPRGPRLTRSRPNPIPVPCATIPGGIGESSRAAALSAAPRFSRGSHCIGGVGTGFTAASRRSLRATFDEIRRDTSPLDDPPSAPVARTAWWWVEPVLVADIEYREASGDGVLRHPSFRSIRPDKTPDKIGMPA